LFPQCGRNDGGEKGDVGETSQKNFQDGSWWGDRDGNIRTRADFQIVAIGGEKFYRDGRGWASIGGEGIFIIGGKRRSLKVNS